MKTAKKLSAILLTSVMMLSLISVLNFTGTLKADAAEIAVGDINNDGSITLNDAMLIINDVAKKEPLPDEFRLNADIDANGNVTLNDAMYIINYVAKKSDIVGPKGPVVFTMDKLSMTIPEGFKIEEAPDFFTVVNPDYPENPDVITIEQGTPGDINQISKEAFLEEIQSISPGIEIKLTKFERTKISGVDTLKTAFTIIFTDPETSMEFPISQTMIFVFDADATYLVGATIATGVYEKEINAALDTITVNK